MASKMKPGFSRFKEPNRGAANADFYPLRMTADHRSEMYVKFAKVMLIFQGPGTDKRKKAVSELATAFKYAGRLISDETYKRETGHSFKPENTTYFYSYFRSRAKKSCEEGYNLIIIDQSMNNPIQMKYYFYLAQTMQYVILPYPPLVENYSDRSVIRGTQADEFKLNTKSPIYHVNLFKHLFCGWFLHDIDSAELREEAGLYVKDCFDNILDFKQVFSRICEPCEFMSHFNMVDKRQSLAFCAVKLLESLRDIQYISSDAFKQFYGSMSKLYIVGFVISPHMIAARVKLTYEQRKLWDMHDDLDEKYQVTTFPSQLLESSKVEKLDDVTLIASKSNRTIITGDFIEKPTEAIHWKAKGRSCHILLGKVKDAPPRNVDYDVSFAVHRERNAVQKYPKDVEPYELERCLVRRIGKYWFIYLKETLIVNGLFATCSSVKN